MNQMIQTTPPPPLDRLRFFKRQLGVGPELAQTLAPWRDAFLQAEEEMGAFLYDLISSYAQTRIVLHHQTSERRLRHNWQSWYRTLWDDPDADAFMASLWRSGTRHVQYGIDHRFISLAYSHVRRFCELKAAEMVPTEQCAVVNVALGRLFDLCLLIETDAFLSSASRCELDVMAGVAHQIRNPLTIIGGNAKALLRDANGRTQEAGEAIIGEALRLERMVRNVGVYVTTLSREPSFTPLGLQTLLDDAFALLAQDKAVAACAVSTDLADGADHVEGDREMLTSLFYHLVQNAAEAATASTPEAPRIALSARPSGSLPGFVDIRVVNSGTLPQDVARETLFLPFHSSKPYGTGFGLPIALLSARKNFGNLTLHEYPGEGVAAELTLPAPGTVDPTGLFTRP